jgi:hypothetical protein
MADFALWSTSCETALWPAGTFLRAYDANRRALEDVIEADPVAARGTKIQRLVANTAARRFLLIRIVLALIAIGAPRQVPIRNRTRRAAAVIFGMGQDLPLAPQY